VHFCPIFAHTYPQLRRALSPDLCVPSREHPGNTREKNERAPRLSFPPPVLNQNLIQETHKTDSRMPSEKTPPFNPIKRPRRGGVMRGKERDKGGYWKCVKSSLPQRIWCV